MFRLCQWLLSFAFQLKVMCRAVTIRPLPLVNNSSVQGPLFFYSAAWDVFLGGWFWDAFCQYLYKTCWQIHSKLQRAHLCNFVQLFWPFSNQAAILNLTYSLFSGKNEISTCFESSCFFMQLHAVQPDTRYIFDQPFCRSSVS